MRYFIIAGEASGDLHGANLVKELQKTDPEMVCSGWGGDLMENAGVKIQKHYKELAFMGFWEVITHIRTISQNFKQCRAQILAFKPDAVVFIDYPGFNLRMAKFVKTNKIASLYYISPQVWAWKEGRVKKIKKVVDKLFVILPFEKEWYWQRHQYKVDFVGHPLVDAVNDFKRIAIAEKDFIQKHQLSEKPIIALLPGSRKQEIKVKLPLMLGVTKYFPDFQFIIAGAASLDASFYHEFIANAKVEIVKNDTYNLLNNSKGALVTSGTATLETALFNVPQVVCYKANYISYLIAKKLVSIKYISLVNLIENREVVKELIQSDLTVSRLLEELTNILSEDGSVRIKRDYKSLVENCGGGGASSKVANDIYNYLTSNHTISPRNQITS